MKHLDAPADQANMKSLKTVDVEIHLKKTKLTSY